MISGKIIQWAIVGALGFVVFFAGRWTKPPEVVEKTQTVHKDRYITKRDTVTIDRPVTRTVYKRQTDTVYVRIPVPVDFRPYGVISASPIRIDGSDVTLTYWRPDSLTFVQDTYQVGRRVWGLWTDVGAQCVPTCGVDARVWFRYKRVRVFGGYGMTEFGQSPVFGARVDLVGWR